MNSNIEKIFFSAHSIINKALINQNINPKIQNNDKEIIWVGLSGGVDSIVLLHLISHIRNKNTNLDIHAIHINHQISDNSQKWEEFCQNTCLSMKIPFHSKKIVIDGKSNLESKARDARYAGFLSYMGDDNGILALAHHGDDQAETFLLRLMRGSGIQGLSAMRNIHYPTNHRPYTIIRPFLSISKQEILEYAHFHNLRWINDESNFDDSFDRNFLRNKVIPLLQERWRHANKSIRQASFHLQNIEKILENKSDYSELFTNQNTFLLNRKIKIPSHLSETTSSEQVQYIEEFRQWLKSNNFLPLSTKKTYEILSIFHLSKVDSQPKFDIKNSKSENAVLKRYKDKAYLVTNKLPEHPLVQNKIVVELSKYKHKSKKLEIELPVGKLEVIKGGNIVLPDKFCIMVNHTQYAGMKINTKKQSKNIKKILQEGDIPPWLRAFFPIIEDYDDKSLIQSIICLPDIAVADKFFTKNIESGYTTKWIV